MIGRITLHRADGTEIITPTLHDDSRYTKQLMGQHALRLRFDWHEQLLLPPQTYALYRGVRYSLPAGYAPSGQAGLYEYDMTMLAPEMLLKERLFFYLEQGYTECRWTMTGTLGQFVHMLALNIALTDPDNPPEVLTLAEVDERTHKTLEADGMSLFDGFTKVAELFGLEWWRAESGDYYLGRLELGERLEVSLSGLGATFTPQGEPLPLIGRLYAFGSGRNLPDSYRRVEADGQGVSLGRVGQTRLMLPRGINYIEGAAGGRDHVEEFEDVYPRYTGTIERTEERQTAGGVTIYQIFDSVLHIRQEQLLPAKPLSLTFETGALRGMEFELAITSGGYEIVPNDRYGQSLPGGSLIPQAGDKYSPHGMDATKIIGEYIPRAEEELRERATQWLERNNRDERDVEVTFNPVALYQSQERLTLGRPIILEGATPTGDKLGRITLIDYPLASPYEVRCIVGNSRPVSFGERLAGEAERAEEKAKAWAERADRGVIEVARRGWAEVQDLGRTLERTMAERFSGKIDPLQVQTMQLIAGDQSLQFIFTEYGGDDEAARRVYPIRYQKEYKQLVADGGYVRHHGIRGVDGRRHRIWRVGRWAQSSIEWPDREYLLYIMAERDGGNGYYQLSEEPLKDNETRHALLVGVLGVERDGTRAFTPLHGFSEVSPGRMITGRLSSADGRTYFDLDAGEIGGNIKIRGIEDRGETEFRGGLMLTEKLEIKNRDEKVVAYLNGRYDPKEQHVGGIAFAAGVSRKDGEETRKVAIWHSGQAQFGDIFVDPKGAIRYYPDGDTRAKPYLTLGGNASESEKIIQGEDTLSVNEGIVWSGKGKENYAMDYDSAPKVVTLRSKVVRTTSYPYNQPVVIKLIGELIDGTWQERINGGGGYYVFGGGTIDLYVRVLRDGDPKRAIQIDSPTWREDLTIFHKTINVGGYSVRRRDDLTVNEVITFTPSASLSDGDFALEITADFLPMTSRRAVVRLRFTEVMLGEIPLGRRANVYIGDYGLRALYHPERYFMASSEGYILEARGRTNIPGVLVSLRLKHTHLGHFTIASVWGAKAIVPKAQFIAKERQGDSSIYELTIPHSIGHTDYSVQVSPESGGWAVYTEPTKSSIRIIMGNPAPLSFSLTLIGRN